MAGNIWVWVGLSWTDRVTQVLDQYGDRITDVSIFGYRVEPDGVYQTFDKSLLATYRAKWPNIRWWGCITNNTSQYQGSMFEVLRTDPTAQANLIAGIDSILTGNPWLTGIDIDLENGGGADKKAASMALFQMIADKVHSMGKLCSAALPALTSTGSVGGEDWVDYGILGGMLDHVAIMSYDMAWVGSAPGPISPASWMQDVYDWAVTQMDPPILSMGLPCYGYMWGIHDTPDTFPPGFTGYGDYRGTAGTYYAVKYMLDGSWIFDSSSADPAGTVDQPNVGWLAYRDPQTGSPWALTGVYDWWEPDAYLETSGYVFGTWDGKPYATRYGQSSGAILGQMADNTPGAAHATFMLQPCMVRDNSGDWVQPRHGYNLTVELLQREPQSSTILDDDTRTAGTLAGLYNVASGSWSQWQQETEDYDPRPYSQYRTTGGELTVGFGVGEVHVQARFQLPAVGSAGVTIGVIRAELSDTGVLSITRNGTILAQTTVSAPGISTDPGNGQAVVGLRIRGTHARAYSGSYETAVYLRLEADVASSDLDGTCGIWASGQAWFDHVRVGDAWWYDPREAVTVQMGDWTWIAGRIPRNGVEWDSMNRFRPLTDVEESETRNQDISLDWDFGHVHDFPVTAYKPRQITIVPQDVDCWLGRVFLCDSQGAMIIHYSDVDYLSLWKDKAVYDWGLQGIALWSLGQEDLRVWSRFAGGNPGN